MDCEMPVLDGYQASTKIREYEHQNNKYATTIIGLSGNSGDAFNRRCRQAGMNDNITKPVGLEALKKIVEKVFKKNEK